MFKKQDSSEAELRNGHYHRAYEVFSLLGIPSKVQNSQSYFLHG